MPKMMTSRQQIFVANYLSGKSGVESARSAGYSVKSARSRAHEFLHEHPLTMAAIHEGQEKLRIDANYNAEQAMRELDKMIAFSQETKNATAYARGIELKAKLFGLLSEKRDDRGASFQINIVGVDSTPSQIKTEVLDG